MSKASKVAAAVAAALGMGAVAPTPLAAPPAIVRESRPRIVTRVQVVGGRPVPSPRRKEGPADLKRTTARRAAKHAYRAARRRYRGDLARARALGLKPPGRGIGWAEARLRGLQWLALMQGATRAEVGL